MRCVIPALHSATGQPSASSPVSPSTSDALLPSIPPASPLPVLQLAPSVPLPRRKPPPQSQPQPQSLRQPPTPTAPATHSSQFSVFSAYEPLLCTPQAPLHPHAHSNPQPTALAPLTIAGEGMWRGWTRACLVLTICVCSQAPQIPPILREARQTHPSSRPRYRTPPTPSRALAQARSRGRNRSGSPRSAPSPTRRSRFSTVSAPPPAGLLYFACVMALISTRRLLRERLLEPQPVPVCRSG